MFVLVGMVMQKFDRGLAKGHVKEEIYFCRDTAMNIHAY